MPSLWLIARLFDLETHIRHRVTAACVDAYPKTFKEGAGIPTGSSGNGQRESRPLKPFYATFRDMPGLTDSLVTHW